MSDDDDGGGDDVIAKRNVAFLPRIYISRSGSGLSVLTLVVQ